MPKTLGHLLRKGRQDMPLTLHIRQSTVWRPAVKHSRSSKEEKTQLIAQLMESAGRTRSYAARVLWKQPKLAQPRRW